jgi:hypothetical protein
MPLSQLKTAAGIDHDFNFLTSIERARQRVEKDVVEARRLLSEKELRPHNEDKLFQKVWYGDELRHVPVQSQPYKKHGRLQEDSTFIDGFDKHVRRRLRYLDIDVLTMPKGMARQRQNRTAFNRRTQTINWQVEWLVYNASQLGFTVPQSQQPLRILYKSLEGTPLHAALASTLDWHRGQLDRHSREQHDRIEIDNEADPDETPNPRKRRKTHHNHTSTKKQHPTPLPPATQDPSTSTWPAAAYTTQYPLTTAWSQTTCSPHIETTLEEQLMTWQFFLLHAARPSATAESKKPPANGKFLIPVSPTDTLTTILSGRTVVEFPTIYVLPAGGQLSEGCVVGDIPRRAAKRAVEGEERGGDASGEGNRNGNTRKRGFDERWGDNKPAGPGHDRGSGQAQGWGRCRGGYAASGKGGKRVKFDGGRAPTRDRPEVAGEEEGEVSEAEEGEVMSDMEEGEADVEGDEVTVEAQVDGGLMDVDGESGSLSEEEIASSVTLRGDEEEGEVVEEARGARPTGGLVDYGSSDEDD